MRSHAQIRPADREKTEATPYYLGKEARHALPRGDFSLEDAINS